MASHAVIKHMPQSRKDLSMDINFKVMSFRVHGLSVCKAKALLKVKTFGLSEIKNRVEQLTRWWRVRTYDFLKHKVFEHNPLRVQYLRNCLPSIGLLKKDHYEIRRCYSYACPWCWNRRYCEVPYKILHRYFRNNNDKLCQYYVRVCEYPKVKYAKAPSLYRDHCQQAIAFCRKLTRRKNVDGGLCHTYLEPCLDGFKIVTKLIVSSKEPVTFDPSFSFSFQFASASARKLSLYFGNYPFALLKRNLGSKGLCMFLKNMPKGNRKFLRFGKLYGKPKDELRRPQS